MITTVGELKAALAALKDDAEIVPTVNGACFIIDEIIVEDEDVIINMIDNEEEIDGDDDEDEEEEED